MRQISWTHNVVILGVTNLIEEKFKVYRRKVIMNLSENTESIEDESFEKEFIKRLRLRTEENVIFWMKKLTTFIRILQIVN